MKRTIAILIAVICFNIAAFAQFPKLPKFEKPKLPTATATPSSGADSGKSQTPNSASHQSDLEDTATPQLPPTAVIKPSMVVRADLDRGYWKMPDAPNYWSWLPEISFVMTGPVADASFVTFDFYTPDGKPWFSHDTTPFAIEAGRQRDVESGGVGTWKDKRSTIATGKFGFKITLKNNLNGTSQELYKGSFVVGKKFAGTEHKDFKNQYAFFVDQDWALPIGYIGYDRKQDAKAPSLQAGMWFRGDPQDLAAYMFYNGKQISSTKVSGQGTGGSVRSIIHEGDSSEALNWQFWTFTFNNVRLTNGGGTYPDALATKNNPGGYEIKVLLAGELVRTAAFTVGANGAIADNNVAAGSGFGALGAVIPVKITPTTEKLTNLSTWKADAFYGNPLTGFTAQ